jgi:hypothetical protein
MDQEYKLSAKRADSGKWWIFGNIKKNKYDNVQASLRVTPELKALIEANDGKWVNFSLFPVDEKRDVPEEAQEGIKQLHASVLDDSSEIPF